MLSTREVAMSSQASEDTDNHKGVRVVRAELNSKDQ